MDVEFNNLTFYLDLIVMIYFFSFKKSLYNYDKNADKYLYIFFISLLITFTGFFNPYVKRISLYFKISNLYLFSLIPFACKNPKNKLYNYIIIIIYLVANFIISAYILKQGHIIPYYFINN